MARDYTVDSFEDPPLAEVERIFELMCARGELAVETARAEDLGRARVPADAGPVFLRLARRARSVTMVEVDVRIGLHDGAAVDDELGGWRLACEPAELDIRLAATTALATGAAADGILDATFSPTSSVDAVLHPTIIHFLVRSAGGLR